MVATRTCHLSEPFSSEMCCNQTGSYLPNELISPSPIKKKKIINVDVFNIKLNLLWSDLYQLLSGSRLGKQEVEGGRALFRKQ